MDGHPEKTIKSEDVHQRFRIIGGKKVLVDKEGYLWHFEDWTEDIARAFAHELGIAELTDMHWKVIRFLREYFLYYGRAPLHRDIKAGLGMTLLELESLFPGGIRRGARLIAGLPNPRGCTG